MFGDIEFKPKRLSVSKVNYIAIHEVNHFLALIIFLIEQKKSREEIRNIITEVSVIENNTEKSLGNVSVSVNINTLGECEFVWLFGCLGAYYYYYGTEEKTWLDNSSADKIREFINSTGGNNDLIGASLLEASIKNDYKLKKLLKKSKVWCSDDEFTELVTSLARKLRKKRILRHKDINNLINSNYNFLKEKVESMPVGLWEEIKNKLGF